MGTMLESAHRSSSSFPSPAQLFRQVPDSISSPFYMAPAPLHLHLPACFSSSFPTFPCRGVRGGSVPWAAWHHAGECRVTRVQQEVQPQLQLQQQTLCSVPLSAMPPHPVPTPPSPPPTRTLCCFRCPSTASCPALAPQHTPGNVCHCEEFWGWRSHLGQGFEGSPLLSVLLDKGNTDGMERGECQAPMPAVPGTNSHPHSLFIHLGQGGYSAHRQP